MSASAYIAPSHLAPIAAGELFAYPIPVGVRLEGHGWFEFHHSWWRTSDFRRDADRDVRAVFLDLLCAAQDEDPVGTLPVSDSALAYVARVTLEDWRSLMGRRLTPLWGWLRCLCSDGSVRLYHPKLLAITERAARFRLGEEERRAADRERKRLKELPDKMVRAGASRRLAEDQLYVLRLDQWLEEHRGEHKSRTPSVVRAAMEAIALAEG